jgi:hypothetical protein
MTGVYADFVVCGGGTAGGLRTKGLVMVLMALRKRCPLTAQDIFVDIGMGNGLPAVVVRVVGLFPRTIGVEVGAGRSTAVVALGKLYGVVSGLESKDMHYSTKLGDADLCTGIGARLFMYCFIAGWDPADVAHQFCPWVRRYRPVAAVLIVMSGGAAGRCAQTVFVGRGSGYVQVCRFAVKQVVSGREFTAHVFHRRNI